MFLGRKKCRNALYVPKKLYLCTVKTKRWQSFSDFGLWCNGNTTDSGPVFLGSSPSSPTEKGVLSNRDTFFCFFFSCSLFGRSTFVTCLLSVIYGFFDTIVDFLMDVNFCRFKNKIFDIMVIKSSRLIKVIRY